MENNAEFNRFTIPLRWGLIIGIVSILTFTIYSMFMMMTVGVWGGMGFLFISFVITMILMAVMATQQRKAMGGYITFKEAFSAIFVCILVVVVLYQLYAAVYTTWIDPEYYDKQLEMSNKMTIEIGASEEQAELAATRAEEQIENQKSFGGKLMGVLLSIILYSLFGFIIAAIVKRNKPEHLQA